MAKENSLDKARKIINEVDAQMRELFIKRMRAAETVAEYKKERGLGILDTAREAEVIKRNSELVEDGAIREYYVSFLKNNINIMTSFLKDITDQTKINTLKIKNIELVPIILKIVKNINIIKRLYILDNKTLDSNCFLTIVDNKNIDYLNCYHMPGIMFNYLNTRRDILIELRNEVKFNSNFMIDNKLNKYSTIYYKKYITLNELTETDAKDLDVFLLINQHLQTINIKKYDLDLIKFLCQLLNKYKKTRIKINIYQNKNNLNDIFDDSDELKKLKANQ